MEYPSPSLTCNVLSINSRIPAKIYLSIYRTRGIVISYKNSGSTKKNSIIPNAINMQF
jgi:hypothetical protein